MPATLAFIDRMKVPIAVWAVAVVREAGACTLAGDAGEEAIGDGLDELESVGAEGELCCREFTLNIGIKESTHTRKATGPITFNHLFSPRMAGILNNPKSAPEKYGARKRMKEKISNTTPKESGIPVNLNRLDLSIENSSSEGKTLSCFGSAGFRLRFSIIGKDWRSRGNS
jgi:hypothetical protein